MTTLTPDQLAAYQNFIINGGARVAQRTAPTISTTAQYGQVDRMQMFIGGGATTSAGTIAQTAASTAGSTGYALRANNVSLSGVGGTVVAQQRIESVNALLLKNKTISCSVKVWHNVGSTITFQINLLKPTAVDNYTSVSTVASGSSVNVPSGTPTTLLLENISAGDVSNGLELQVIAASGTVVLTTFDFTEFQLNIGAAAFPFQSQRYADELFACKRYYQKLFEPPMRGITTTATANVNRMGMMLPVEMRVAPTCVFGALPIWDGTTTTTLSGVSASYHSTNSLEIDGTTAVALAASRGAVAYHNTGTAAVTCDAEI